MTSLEHHRVRHAILKWDERQDKADIRARRPRNIYRIGIALKALDRVDGLMRAGATLREALLQAFCDRLLSACLKAVGEPDFTLDEKRSADRRSYEEFLQS